MTPGLWLVEGQESDVYLFGETVGVGHDDVWLVEPITTAFSASRQLWCEVAGVEEIANSPLLAHHGLSDGPLSEMLGASERTRLDATARTVGLDPATLEGLRPWLVGQVLEHAHRAALGVDATVGVHDVLVELARYAGTPIHAELPDADATLGFFGGMSATVELEYLAWTLDRVEDDGTELTRQVDAWLVGDRRVVDAQVATMTMRYPHLYDCLLVERNQAWVPRIVTMLGNSTPSFILVGDSHLSGDDSLLSLLTRAGRSSRRVA